MGTLVVHVAPRAQVTAVAGRHGDAIKISEKDAPLACYVAGVDEEVEIARATLECLLKRSAGGP